MKRAANIIVTVAAVVCLGGSAHSAGQSAPAKAPLRIFYAGHPGSDRERDFVAFLSQHFAEVKTGDLAKFQGEAAKDSDVVVLDYDGDGFKSPRPSLSRDYARPTVTVGVVGAFICGNQGLKAGYL